MISRFAWVLPAAAAVLFASCADQNQSSPTEPPTLSVSPSDDATRSAIGDIRRQINALFPERRHLRWRALRRLGRIVWAMRHERVENARRRAVRFAEFTLRHYRRGVLLDPNGPAPPTTEAAVCDLLGSMLEFVRLPRPEVCPLGPNSAAAIVGREGGMVLTGSEQAGVDIPEGSLEQTVLVTIQPLPGPFGEAGGPLRTDLNQFGPFYEIRTFPEIEGFNVDVTVGLCIEDLDEGFRLARNNDAGTGIEILPLAPAPFLNCNEELGSVTDAKPTTLWGRAVQLAKGLFAPAPLHAGSALIFGGLGGSSGSFSPFGAVDIPPPDEPGPDQDS